MIHQTTGRPGEGMTYTSCTLPTQQESAQSLAVPAVGSESGACSSHCFICGQSGDLMRKTHPAGSCPAEPSISFARLKYGGGTWYRYCSVVMGAKLVCYSLNDVRAERRV